MEIKIIRGKQKKKFVTVVYGEPGVGKSTFGSLYPSPVFIGNEVPHHIDVDKAPSVTTYEELLASAKAIKAEQEKEPRFKTIVVDSISGIQDNLVSQLLGAKASDKDSKLSIHTYGGGFAVGQRKVLSRFVDVYNILDSIYGIDDIVLLSHTRKRTVKTTLDEVDKLTPALETKILEFFFQRADNMFFLDIVRNATKSGDKILSKNERVVRTEGTQLYMAKNRSHLKEEYSFTGKSTIENIRGDILKQLGFGID